MLNIYETPPFVIGRHEWRCIVRFYGKNWKTGERQNCTEYHWRRIGETAWRRSQEWPTYNPNDTYMGTPRSLMKLWTKYQEQIAAALKHTAEDAGPFTPPTPAAPLLETA